MVILQHALDVVGMGDEIHAAEAESHGDDVAILARATKNRNGSFRATGNTPTSGNPGGLGGTL